MSGLKEHTIMQKYPIGLKVTIKDDGELYEVEGYKRIGNHDYLLFTDGSMAFVENVE